MEGGTWWRGVIGVGEQLGEGKLASVSVLRGWKGTIA